MLSMPGHITANMQHLTSPAYSAVVLGKQKGCNGDSDICYSQAIVPLPTQTAHMESTAEMKEKRWTHTQNVTLYMPGVQPHH